MPEIRTRTMRLQDAFQINHTMLVSMCLERVQDLRFLLCLPPWINILFKLMKIISIFIIRALLYTFLFIFSTMRFRHTFLYHVIIIFNLKSRSIEQSEKSSEKNIIKRNSSFILLFLNKDIQSNPPSLQMIKINSSVRINRFDHRPRP